MAFHCVLPSEPSSAGRARRLARDVLHEWDEEQALDVVTLLVSELVTNAVLHAGSQIEVDLSRHDQRLRVEVADHSSVAPAPPAYSVDASTGRGLDLVDLLTTDWGVTMRLGDGKVVWFEVPASHSVDTVSAPEVAALTTVTDEAEIILQNAPVQLFAAMQQHSDALLREYTLVALERGQSARPHLDVDRSTLPAQLQAAVEANAEQAEITVKAPRGSKRSIAAVQAAFSEADRMAASGELLAVPALPEITACRDWFLTEVVNQLQGLLPSPWRPPTPDESRTYTAVDLALALEHLGTAVIVANDENRIAHANRAAEELLGWSAGELAGQRLTVLIPPRLHDSHVAGYSRYLVTGDAHLVGRSVRVPARHRDGHEIEIDLVLNAYRPQHGRTFFVAALQELPQATGAPALASWSRCVEAVTGLLEEHDAPSAATAIAAAVGDNLGWDVCGLWRVDDDVLCCLAAWARSEDSDPPFLSATRRMKLVRGQGLPGQVWAANEPVTIRDLVAAANFPRSALALTAGLRSGHAVPVRHGGELVGVLEVFSSEARDIGADAAEALATIGRMVGLAWRR